MLNLSAEAVQALPVDERGLLVLQDLVNTNEWNEHNYLLAYRGQPSDRAIAEATAWLRGRAFIARTPGQNTSDGMFVTARGHEALRQGLVAVQAVEHLEQGLHPRIERGFGGSFSSANTSRRCSSP